MTKFIFEYLLFLSKHFDVDPLLVFAIGYIESGFREDQKYRFEPAFYKKYILNKIKYIGLAPRIVASSYGYMQIMFTTAEMVGYDFKEEDIRDDKVNLFYAIKYLAYLKRVFPGTNSDLISAYNAGTPARKRVGNKITYKNKKYLYKVLDRVVKIKKNGIRIEGKVIKL